MTIIFGFIAAAMGLIFFEVILPGGILGALAVACILIATWFGYDTYGLMGGVGVFLGASAASALLVFMEMKFLAKTGLGQAFFLQTSVEGHTKDVPSDILVGKKGTTITRLNPSGMIAIGEGQHQAFSQDGYLDENEPISVVSADTFKLTVKKI